MGWGVTSQEEVLPTLPKISGTVLSITRLPVIKKTALFCTGFEERCGLVPLIKIHKGQRVGNGSLLDHFLMLFFFFLVSEGAGGTCSV